MINDSNIESNWIIADLWNKKSILKFSILNKLIN